ncbi:MAG: hypothetical protein HC771_18400 [Synechococcales cyanobacterium CRU_2_2]|nr:hypothetical protein [Synechococcales cyanobacterium CRU_2_2]
MLKQILSPPALQRASNIMGNLNFGRVLSAATVVVVGLAGAKLLSDRFLRQDAQNGALRRPAVLEPAAPKPPPLRYTVVDETHPDPKIQTVVQDYVTRLTGTGVEAARQGVWVQSGDRSWPNTKAPSLCPPLP